MNFDNSDKKFLIKILPLFLVLTAGVINNHSPYSVDISAKVKKEMVSIQNKNSVFHTLSIKKTSNNRLYNNDIR